MVPGRRGGQGFAGSAGQLQAHAAAAGGFGASSRVGTRVAAQNIEAVVSAPGAGGIPPAASAPAPQERLRTAWRAALRARGAGCGERAQGGGRQREPRRRAFHQGSIPQSAFAYAAPHSLLSCATRWTPAACRAAGQGVGAATPTPFRNTAQDEALLPPRRRPSARRSRGKAGVAISSAQSARRVALGARAPLVRSWKCLAAVRRRCCCT